MDKQELSFNDIFHEGIQEYIQAEKYWFVLGLTRLITLAVENLHQILENSSDSEVSWNAPTVELQLAVEWDFEKNTFIYGSLAGEENTNREKGSLKISYMLLKWVEIAILKHLTHGVYKKKEQEYVSLLNSESQQQYDRLPTSEKNKFFHSCFKPYLLGNVLWKEPERIKQACEKAWPEFTRPSLLHLTSLLEAKTESEETFSFQYTHENRHLKGAFRFSFHPLVVNVDEKHVFYPIRVRLLLTNYQEHPTLWTKEEREHFWRSLLDTLLLFTQKWIGTLSEDETLQLQEISHSSMVMGAPREYISSSRDPVPMPRAMKTRESMTLERGIGRMFSGYNQIQNIDIQGKLAQAEANRLFWNLVEEKCNQAVAEQNSLLSWHKQEEAGKTTLFLHGFQESQARLLWGQICKAANAGEGGAGLEIADPAFFSRNRMENGKIMIETQLILWPEESFRTKDGFPALPLRFRRTSSPGYQAFMKPYQNKPHFSDGWLWIPKGNIKEGFRLGGLSTLLFPEGRKALESLKQRQIENYEEELNRIFTNQQPSLFREEEREQIQELQFAIHRVKIWLYHLNSFDISTDLFLCIFEAFYRQRNAWYAEKVILPSGKEVDTKPWRILCIDPQFLRSRLDPREEWGKNWRHSLFEKLEALSTFERQTRTIQDKKMDVGDRFIRRVIDGWAGIEEGNAPDWDSGLGLTKLLKQAHALPVNAFFIEVSLDFMARFITNAVDPSGVIHWGIQAGKAAQQAELAKPEPNPKEANRVRKELEQKARKQPYYQHSPRLTTFSNLREWPLQRKLLAYGLLEELNSHQSDGIHTPCNGSRGHGYKIKTWMEKAGYLKPNRVRRTSNRQQYELFVDDLRELYRSLHLKIELKQNPDLKSEAVLHKLEILKEVPKEASELLIKIYLPSNYEDQLEEKLQDAGVFEKVEHIQKLQQTREVEEITPFQLIVARRKAKLTQVGLATKLGISRSMVAQWESQLKPIPKEKQTQIKELLATHLEE